ncbi:uncharacterized protein RB166_012461 [Leptodactylus fuscus]
MKTPVLLWSMALACFLVSQVSGSPDEMQSDDWRVSSILESTMNQYVKPYTGEIVAKVTSSRVWNVFGQAINGVQGAINLSGEYLYAYYQDHLQAPTQNTLQWIENKTKPIAERVRERFKGKEE